MTWIRMNMEKWKKSWEIKLVCITIYSWTVCTWQENYFRLSYSKLSTVSIYSYYQLKSCLSDHATLCKSPEIWTGQNRSPIFWYVVLINNHEVEHYGIRIKILQGRPFEGWPNDRILIFSIMFYYIIIGELFCPVICISGLSHSVHDCPILAFILFLGTKA